MGIPSLLAVLAGQGAAPMTLHLAKIPMPTPYTLATMTEADFPGYLPSPVSFSGRYEPGTELASLSGTGLFLVTGDTDPPPCPGLWITAEPVPGYTGPLLIAVAPSPTVSLKRGQQYVGFDLLAPTAW